MSFSDWSNNKKKKKNNSNSNSKASSFGEWRNSKHGITEEEEENSTLAWRKDEIAPVRETEKRTWFDKGAFDDGYQFGDVTKTVLGTIGDTASDLLAGVVGMAENVADAGVYLMDAAAQASAKATGYRNPYAHKFTKQTQEFIEKDTINEKAVADTILLGIDKTNYEDYSVWGDKTDSLVQSGGQLLGTVGLQAVGVPWFVTTGVTSFGSGVEEAFNEGASYGEAGLSGTIQAGADILTEKLFGGSGLGEKGLINLDGLTKGISNKVVKSLVDFGVDMTAEGAEEVAASVMTNLGSSLYKEENLGDLLFSEEAVDEYIESFVGGAVLGGGMNLGKVSKSVKSGRDYRTGLTANEQKVFDKVYEDAIADAEKDGKKLTKNEKAELYDSIMDKLDKGYISTDTIEEVLGGESYTEYKEFLDIDTNRKNELEEWKKEYDALYKMKNMEKSDEQIDRQAQLKKQIEAFDPSFKSEELKTKLSNEVRSAIAKDGKLLESYNEIARKGQAFTADLTKYKGKQKEAIERAIKSGVLNNTNRSHELVDILAKIEADKGIIFDYTDNEKLKASGFAVEGKTVNGFEKNGTVTLNVQSAKSWQSVVGHEITHILEGTSAYTELRSALYAYAESKGELASRKAALTELYKDMDADIDAELTADLVGDYLFGDKKFISNLTANKNVFQKIWDEVKYLCKVATGKEKASIEKVEREFTKVWENFVAEDISETTDGDADNVNYSLVEDQKTIDFLENQDYIVTYKAMVQIDGKLYPPMASQNLVEETYTTKKGETKTRKVRKLKNPSVLGRWQQSDERPDLVTKFVKPSKKYPDGYGQFDLLKSNGKTTGGVAYNPYEHTSNIVLNDQFAEAYQRPELVTVEYHIPVSELTSGYKAQYAKDPVGLTDWKAGGVAQKLKNSHRDVYLTRWSKPVRVLDDAEVAAKYKEILDKEEGISVPWNVVTPNLREELEKVGVPIDYSDIKAGSTIRNFEAAMRGDYDKKSKKAKYSVSADSEGNQLSKEQSEYFKDSKAVDEDGNLRVVYHGTYEDFNVFDIAKTSSANAFGKGHYFTSKKADAQNNYATMNGADVHTKIEELAWIYFEEMGYTEADYESNDAVEEWNAAYDKAEEFYKSGRVVQAYLDIKNPVYARGSELYDANGNFVTARSAEYLKKLGYDGIIDYGVADRFGHFQELDDDTVHYVVFDSNQIKLTTNKTPTTNPDIRYSVSEKTDTEYMTAVEKGDMETAQRMVDEVAKANGYTINAYHGTKDSFTVFKHGQENQYDAGYLGKGFYFTDKRESAEEYSEWKKGQNDKIVMGVALRMENPLKITDTDKPHLIAVQEALGLHLTDFGDYLATAKPWISKEITEEAKKQGYDGIVRYVDFMDETFYVVFDSNQVKSTNPVTYDDKGNIIPLSQRFNKANEDIRFSLSKSVEETKNLVAVHNLSEEKLLKSLQLGGLPMPSIAIARAKEGHGDYGKISLVFGKDTIDPQNNRNNKVYSGDAWTPVYPRIDHKINEKVQAEIEERINGLIPENVARDLGGLHIDSYNLEQELNRNNGSIINVFRNNAALKYAFLAESGAKPELPTKNKRLAKYSNHPDDAIVRVAENVSKEKLQGILREYTTEQIYEVEPEIRKAVNEYFKEKYKKLPPNALKSLLRKDELSRGDIDDYAQEALDYLKNGIVQEIDYSAAKTLIDEAIDTQKYESWVKDVFANIVEKEGVRNNKDIFTPSGNRRSFDALHYEHNLENVIKAMRESGEKGIGTFGRGNIFGASTTEYKSIADIKDAANTRLQNMPQEEYEAIRKGFSERFFELAYSLPIHKDSFTATDSAANMLIEAIAKFKTRSGIANYLRTESKGWANYNDYVVDDLIQLVQEIREMPTNYFEAKPQRAVGFNEVATAIIPDNASAELKQMLTDKGVNFVEYESGNEQARIDVLNSLEEYKFSLSKQGEQPAPIGNYSTPLNETYLAPTKEDIAKNATQPVAENAMDDDIPMPTDADAPPEMETEYYNTPDTTALDDKALKNIIKSLRKTLSLTAEETRAIQSIVQEYSTTEFPDKAELFKTIKEKYGEKIWRERDNDIADAKRWLRTQKLYISDYVKSDITDYPQFRKSIQGKIKLGKDGLSVDKYYDELVDAFPNIFNYNEDSRYGDLTNPLNQIRKIAAVANQDIFEYMSQPLSDSTIEEAVNIIDNEVTTYKENLTRMAAEDTANEALDSVAPPKAEQIMNGTRGDALLVQSLDNFPIKTVEDRLAEKIRAVEASIADTKQLRREAEVNFDKQIESLSEEFEGLKDKSTKRAAKIIDRVIRLNERKASMDADYAKRISDLEARAEKMNTEQYKRAMHKQDAMTGHAEFAKNLLGDTTTWVDKKTGIQYATNTEHRNFRDIVRDENGNKDIARADAIDDALNGRYNREEAEKKREKAQIVQKYADLKITNAEAEYIQMLGEFRHNPETTLTEENVKEYYEAHQDKIDTAKVDKVIELARQDYDNLIKRVNEKLREQGMKEIPYRQGYFPHYTEPKQNFIQKLLNWKVKDNEIPTSIAGLTETFRPVKSWQSFDKTRYSDETDYNFLKGFDAYLEGSLDWIYHLDTLQKRRAVENHIRFTHSDEGIQARIKEVYANEEYDADEAQAQIEHILAEAKNPLNNFVQDFTTKTNILANKKNSLDRTVEQLTNRKIYSTMTNVQNRTSANMVLANVRSALTNFIPITQSWAQVSPMRSLQAAKDTIANAIKDDGTINKSTFLTNRLREVDNLYKSNWDKVLDKAGIMFEIVDNFSSQVIWRSKYNDNLAKGMSESEAIANADQFAENVMAGRSKGNEPTIFNAKNPLVKAFTMFQLEVNNQYGYFFKDVPNDLKAETEHWKFNLAKGYTTAFIGAYVYNALLEQVAGSGAALDPIGIIEDLLRDLGLFDDDEEEEPKDVVMNLIENVGGELPFVGGTLFGGGRIPISSALPYGDNGLVDGVGNLVTDVTEGNWKNVGKEMMNPVLNIGLPVGGGQLKKTVQGLKMFNTDEEHPVMGSYTDSGALRFPVEDTLGNRIQAGIFGQYANKNAREYFDNGYAPLKEKQIQEYMDVDLPIADYWKYRDGLKGLKTNDEKADFINSLDIEDWQKNLLMNNILDRKEDVDMTNYDDSGDWEEFDYAQKNPEKSALAKSVGGYSAYKTYSKDLDGIKADKDENGKSVTGSKKEKVIEYINNLDADYETKIILFKSEYPNDDTYNADIINYLNNREDLTYDERVKIYEALGFTVKDGYVYWD